MMGGHGGHDHGTSRETPSGDGVKDPVCGMIVNPNEVAAAAVYGGSTHYFCSTECRDKFEKAPDEYLGTAAPVATAHGGHHHA